MVSLGPLSLMKYCTYKCPFCYVHGDFKSYASLSIPEILYWLANTSDPYDIVYVSGDTDSFAPPRTDEGLKLLDALATLNVDLLFTSRFLFSEKDLNTIGTICESLCKRDRLLFGCVSVTQLTVPHLEPPPIPPPHERLMQLGRFRDIGVVPVLAMRPFLPVVPDSDYTHILEAAARERIEIVLGGSWFTDREGKLELSVFRGPTPEHVSFSEGQMDFDENETVWRIYKATTTEHHVRRECGRLSLAFFDRSRPMIEAVRRDRRAIGSSTSQG